MPASVVGAFRHNAPPWRLGASGLTLVEMLVVFALASMLATALLQSLGFFVARHEAVARAHRLADSRALRQQWFQTAVRGIVPVGVSARRFRGDEAAFVATTLQPLAAEPGMPTRVRWTVAKGEAAVDYAELPGVGPRVGPGVAFPSRSRAASESAVAWRLPVPAAGSLAFRYAGRDGTWHPQWPTAKAPGEWTPSAVRLTAGENTLWIARVGASPYPLPHEAMFE